MARLSSRELALERRKALTTSGKKSSVAAGDGANRVRTVADARPTRTNAAAAAEPASAPATPAAVAPQRTTSFTAAPAKRSSQVKPHRDPSRELVLARRDALSRRGKTADTSRDRNRADVARQTKAAAPAAAPAETTKSCGCGGKRAAEKASLSAPAPKLSARTERRSATPKRRAIENPSRALVLARREAMSKHGKTAGKQPTSAAAVARQANPDLTSRELAQQVRELRTKAGARNKQSAGVTRPTGPNRHGAKQAAAADAHWKVGESTTTGGQTVTGTQANRSVKTTGNAGGATHHHATHRTPLFGEAVAHLARGSHATTAIGSGLVGGDVLGAGHALAGAGLIAGCLLYTSPSPRDVEESRMPSSA